MSELLIAGLDPGVNFAWAILDFEGNIIEVSSSRVANNIEKILLRHGKPVIIATDVKRVDSRIRKIAANLGARYIRPDHDLKVSEKELFSKIFLTENRHERDSLAAAFYAFNSFKNLLKKAKKGGGDWKRKAAKVILKKAHNLKRAADD